MNATDKLKHLTFVVQHNPNCAKPFLVRLVGPGMPQIDYKPYRKTTDLLGFGSTLEEASTEALANRIQLRAGVKVQEFASTGFKFSLERSGKEVARAFFYIMRNDLHKEPFGLLEDVFVEESFRGKGLGSKLVKEVIEKARECRCYKLIATSRHSRPKVHDLYERLGFQNWGLEFRMNL